MGSIRIYLLSLLFGCFSSLSLAGPIVQTDACVNDAAATCAFGITDLEVSGATFDVAFSQLSYDDLFATTDPYFLGDYSGAYSSMSAMIAPLNSAGITGIIGDPTSAYPPSGISLPYQLPGSGSAITALAYSSGSDFGLIAGMDVIPSSFPLSSIDGYVAYAVFVRTDLTEVPAPPTLALFALSLLLLRLRARN